MSELLRERFWSKLGVEQDAYFTVDSTGVEFAGGGLNLTLRDMARFGEMMRLGGRFNGQQIVPAAVVDDIRRGGEQATISRSPATRCCRVELPRRCGGCRTTRTARSPRAASTARRSTSIRRRRW